MTHDDAIAAFGALSQPARLKALRKLVKAGPEGIRAGDLQDIMGMAQSTASMNLAVLLKAGLVRNQRESRSIRYYANFETLRALIIYLLEDCCGGDPVAVAPLLDLVTDGADADV